MSTNERSLAEEITEGFKALESMRNNEPVAEKINDDVWRVSKEYMDFPIGTLLYTHPVKEQDEPNWKEMYWEMHELNHKHWSELKAHPVKELTLTNEEILEVAKKMGWRGALGFLINFARAILRKASEK